MHMNCDKAAYDTWDEANRKLNTFSRQNTRNRKPKRVYKCECGKYHLTSLNKSKRTYIKNIYGSDLKNIKKTQNSFIRYGT